MTQETILVVEDEILIRMPIVQYLRDCGYKVIEGANADEAMTVLSHKETVLHVIFTDIEMPGTLDGFGLSKWVREHRPSVAVILAGTLPRTFHVILSDRDQWAVEAEWPDGTLERINTFNDRSFATDWITTQSEAWLEVRNFISE